MGPVRKRIAPVVRFGILTSINEVCVNQTEYRVHGVRVERFMPLTAVQGPRPIVFVHGGCHGVGPGCTFCLLRTGRMGLSRAELVWA